MALPLAFQCSWLSYTALFSERVRSFCFDARQMHSDDGEANHVSRARRPCAGGKTGNDYGFEEAISMHTLKT
jgi:hypothetical protein